MSVTNSLNSSTIHHIHPNSTPSVPSLVARFQHTFFTGGQWPHYNDGTETTAKTGIRSSTCSAVRCVFSKPTGRQMGASSPGPIRYAARCHGHGGLCQAVTQSATLRSMD